eukprot:6367766-Prymnesium_polylepis.1
MSELLKLPPGFVVYSAHPPTTPLQPTAATAVRPVNGDAEQEADGDARKAQGCPTAEAAA